MNVLSITMGSATGGVPVAIAKAFDRFGGDWEARCLVSTINYIEYPTDIPWSIDAVAHYWQWADVVHLHHGFMTADRIVKGRYTGKRLHYKPAVVEFHGTGYREEPLPFLIDARKRKAVVVTSTLDLWLIAPDETEWLPQPINVERMSKMRQPRDDGRVLIAHAPTNRQVKSTEKLLEAVARLQAEGFPVDLDLIERVPWTKCMERKARADIYFDQVILGYGCNALEAWGMGIPVVAGAADQTLDEMERRFGQLPFYHATEETIYDALKELVVSPKLRAKYGKIGYQYVKKYHDEAVVVELLKGLYRQAMGIQEEEAA